MRKLPANLLKRWLMASGALALAGALAWAMWPKPWEWISRKRREGRCW
jgi:hypothetical protein